MAIKVLKTFEIPDNMWAQIADGFSEAFGLHVDAKDMKTGFCVMNKLGYGYHAIALTDDGNVMGFNTFSPVFYKDGLKSVVSGSTFVREKYRSDDFLFMDLMMALRKRVKEDGYLFEMGVPNHNSRKFAAQILKCKYIADLDYYILPLNPSKCIHKSILRFSDYPIRWLLHGYTMLQLFLSNLFDNSEKSSKYEMEIYDGFWDDRFPINKYSRFVDRSYHGYYRIVDEDGAKTAYILDFRDGEKRTYYSLVKTITHILRKEKIDAILFVGHLRMKQWALFKVPSKIVPKPLPLTYYILNKADKERFSDMEDICNWNFSLMNFDVR